jgi:hypothetical protein
MEGPQRFPRNGVSFETNEIVDQRRAQESAMSQYEVSRFLFQYNRNRDLRDTYANDRVSALVGFDVTDQERKALAGPDFGALYEMGTHPLLLIYLSNNLAVPPHEYVAAVRGTAKIEA